MGGLPLVVVQGGAVEGVPQPVHLIHSGVKSAALSGYRTLLKTGSPSCAVEAAINVMEQDTTFNAGRGSTLTNCGKIEMEACIMEGTRMRAGGVALVDCILHPISLARKVLWRSDCVLLCGEGVRDLAEREGVTLVSQAELQTPGMTEALQDFRRWHGQSGGGRWRWGGGGQDTVGCVVIDWQGRVASGCSTGGPTGRKAGRIGAASIPGSGTYCDDNIGAVACTGHGESILQFNLAHRILSQMKKGLCPEDAAVRELCCLGRRYGRPGGAIAVNRRGQVGIAFTTERLAWACLHGSDLHYGYEPGQNIVEILARGSC